MKYPIACLTLLATLAAGAQTNTYYNPDAEPDGQIGSSDLLEFLPLFGNSFTPDTCLCGCPSGGELDGLTSGDTLSTFELAALAFQAPADSVYLEIHLDSYGSGNYPFLGDTIIEYPCYSYGMAIAKRYYSFDEGVVNYTTYPNAGSGCGQQACNDYQSIEFDDSGSHIRIGWPNLTGVHSYDALWSLPDDINFTEQSENTWVPIVENYDGVEFGPDKCYDAPGSNDWHVCFRLISFEVHFID